MEIPFQTDPGFVGIAHSLCIANSAGLIQHPFNISRAQLKPSSRVRCEYRASRSAALWYFIWVDHLGCRAIAVQSALSFTLVACGGWGSVGGVNRPSAKADQTQTALLRILLFSSPLSVLLPKQLRTWLRTTPRTEGDEQGTYLFASDSRFVGSVAALSESGLSMAGAPDWRCSQGPFSSESVEPQ